MSTRTFYDAEPDRAAGRPRVEWSPRMVTAAIKEQILSDLDRLSPEQQRQAADLVRALATPLPKGAQQFLVVIERAGANYSAYCPDLPGCVATGDTREETERNMREALQLHVEGMVEDSEPIPEPSALAEYMSVA